MVRLVKAPEGLFRHRFGINRQIVSSNPRSVLNAPVSRFFSTYGTMLLLAPLNVLGLFSVTGIGAEEVRGERFELKGQSISTKHTIGKVLVIKEKNELSSFNKRNLSEDESADELVVKTERAFDKLGRQIDSLVEEDPSLMGFWGLFSAIRVEIPEIISSQRVNLASAVDRFLNSTEALSFKNSPDEKRRTHYDDLERICLKLLNIYHGSFFDIEEELKAVENGPIILAAVDLSVSDLAVLSKFPQIKGVIRQKGNRLDHTSIRVRNRGCSGMVAIKGNFAKIQTGDGVVIDAHKRKLIVNPDEAEVDRYTDLIAEQDKMDSVVSGSRKNPSSTKDGVEVRIMGNIMHIDDTTILKEVGASGIGLTRTEIFFRTAEDGDRQGPPSYNEQLRYYQSIVDSTVGMPVTIRTIDISPDKQFPYLVPLSDEALADPYRIGVGACLDPEGPYFPFFKEQLRALLSLKNLEERIVKILFPLVLERSQVIGIMGLVSDVMAEVPGDDDLYRKFEFGIMVEHPNAVSALSDMLGGEKISFISIGTNDLANYSVGANRYSSFTAADELDPRHLKQIESIVKQTTGKMVGLSCCGDMGGSYQGFLTLLAYGVREISVPAPFVDAARFIVQNINYSDLGELKRRIEQVTTAEAVRSIIDTFIDEKISDGSWKKIKTLIEQLRNGSSV